MARMPSTIVFQAEPDGTLSEDYDGPHPSMAEREDLLRRGFAGGGWTLSDLQSDEEHRKTTLAVSKGDRTYSLDVFIFPNLAWSSGGRDKKEKRIQLSRDYAEHAREFNLPKDGANRCLLLGIYRRNGHVIICAWDAQAYRDHPNPNSCYVRVEAIADAMRVGLGQSVDSKRRLVCCFKPDLLAYYVENMQALHERVVVNEAHLKASSDAGPYEITEKAAGVLGDINQVPADLPRNRIVYGAPGTGKSHLVNDQVAKHFGQSNLHERVTFHPEFTYAQFVGSYRPVPLYRPTEVDLVAADLATSAGRHEPIIDYRFVPGPFLRMVTRALKNPLHSFVLVIEELNRANAPSVFGEAFQLLDRDESGEGKFTVELPPEARDYMRAQGLTNSLQLPRNFYLWATMNSADQGVLPLDAAFKRRWSFEYVPLDMGEAVVDGCTIRLKFLPEPIKWNDFRRVVNAHLARREVAEDRLLGPFFMRAHELSNADAFVNKLLLYLRDDVLRHNPEVLFRGASLTYGALVKSYQAGENIFVEDVSFGIKGSG